MKTNNLLFTIILIGIIGVFAGLVVVSKMSAPAPRDLANGGRLEANTSNYDFGEISMKDGDVSYEYILTNPTDKPVTVTKLYTSCMCTEAEISRNNEPPYGPYSMPGHGAIPDIALEVGPKEAAKISVTFDPSAHGSAGIGNISREVTAETTDGTIELTFEAKVRP